MFKIGIKKIGRIQPTYIIAEPGINHFGDIKLAKELIDTAKKCGADAIKFQTIFPDEVYSKLSNPKLFEKLEQSILTKKQWLELKNHAKDQKIHFFSTPAGIRSAKLLQEIGVPCFKIGSGELNRFDLLQYVSSLKKPVLISTGMTTIDDIQHIVNIFKNSCPIALLHCNSAYPTPFEDTNLSSIPYYQDLFGLIIGYSDHTIGIDACVAAVALGASIIEKHFILDKSAWDQESQLSSSPNEFKKMINHIRLTEKLLGKPRIGITHSEKQSVKNMRYSIAAAKNIKSHTKIKKSMLTTLRPGNGISPLNIDKLIGLKTKKSFRQGDLLSWKAFNV